MVFMDDLALTVAKLVFWLYIQRNYGALAAHSREGHLAWWELVALRKPE